MNQPYETISFILRENGNDQTLFSKIFWVKWLRGCRFGPLNRNRVLYRGILGDPPQKKSFLEFYVFQKLVSYYTFKNEFSKIFKICSLRIAMFFENFSRNFQTEFEKIEKNYYVTIESSKKSPY